MASNSSSPHPTSAPINGPASKNEKPSNDHAGKTQTNNSSLPVEPAKAKKSEATWSLKQHSDWMCYYEDLDDTTFSTPHFQYITTKTSSTSSQPNNQGKTEKNNQSVGLPSSDFVFFVPTNLVKQLPLKLDTSFNFWYDPSHLETCLSEDEDDLEIYIGEENQLNW